LLIAKEVRRLLGKVGRTSEHRGGTLISGLTGTTRYLVIIIRVNNFITSCYCMLIWRKSTIHGVRTHNCSGTVKNVIEMASTNQEMSLTDMKI